MVSIEHTQNCPCCGTKVRVVSKDSTYSGTIHNCKGTVKVESTKEESKTIPKTNNFMKKIFDKQKDDKFSKRGRK